MSYTKTQWVNDQAPAINETNLNKIEQGIYDNDSHIGDLTTLTTTANTDLVSAINEVDSHADTNTAKLNGTQVAGDMVVDSIRTKNLFNSNRVVKLIGTLVEQLSNGLKAIVLSNAQYQYATIEIDKTLLGKTLTLSATMTPSSTNTGGISIVFLANDYSLVGSSIAFLADTGNITFTIPSSFPSGASRIGILFYSNFAGTGVANDYVNYTNIQLEESSSATTYKQYLELDKNEIYTIGEQRIGTWIDGKPLYRATIPVNSVSSSANNYEMSIAIKNLKEIVNISGSVKTTFAAWKPINHVYVTNNGVIDPQFTFQLYSISATAIGFSYGNWWKSVFEKAFIIVEYTKTTD